MNSKSQQLRAAVKERLIPHIQASGFQADTRKMWKHDPYRHQTRRFMRWNAKKLELVNIQFDKHGSAKFVFNLGVVPAEGVDYLGHHYTQMDADISALPQNARLYAGNPYVMRWFGFPLLKVPVLRNPSAENIVQHAIRLFPQAEAWLREGIVGPNIRVQMGIGATGKKPGELE
jgi:hypothetical protein